MSETETHIWVPHYATVKAPGEVLKMLDETFGEPGKDYAARFVAGGDHNAPTGPILLQIWKAENGFVRAATPDLEVEVGYWLNAPSEGGGWFFYESADKVREKILNLGGGKA
jgi:hypothetical protein